MYYLLRWALFLLVGIPLQLVVYLVYIPFSLLVDLKNKTKSENIDPFINPQGNLARLVTESNDPTRDGIYLDDGDDHAVLVHANFWDTQDNDKYAEQGLANLVKENGTLKRRYPIDGWNPISGDCLSSWCYAYVNSKVNRPDLVHKVAMNYLKNCFGMRHTNNKVSARCSNGGVNTVFDGWHKLNYPCFGPQFYTSAALLALAKREAKWYMKPFWEIVFQAHNVLLGGWLYWAKPIVHVESVQGNYLGYLDHITMLNLWTLAKIRKCNGVYKYAIRKIALNLPSKNCNPFFHALALEVKAITDPLEWDRAKDILLSMRYSHGFIWQEAVTNRSFMNREPKSGQHTCHLATVAKKLLHSPINK